MSYQNSNERLLAAQMAIENALSDADIKAELALFGYDEARLLAGKALSEEAKSLSQTQLVEYGEQYAASNDFYAKWEAAKTAYSRSLKVARIAFKDNSKAQSSLKAERRAQRQFLWLAESGGRFLCQFTGKPGPDGRSGRLRLRRSQTPDRSRPRRHRRRRQ
ncbi:MAG: hypothetical protein IPH82_05615 [Chloroflexi bacterium]|nr:hypothetical protein [Chloroflexota bacterium]